MKWKKQNYIPIYIILFIFLVIVGYYVGALFYFPDFSILNVSEKMAAIQKHPFKWYWNEATLVSIGCCLLLWLWMVVMLSFRNRNFHFNQEHGTAQFADIENIKKKLADPETRKNRSLTKHIQISKNILSNNNMLIIGSSGSYKTTSMLIPNILKATSSYVILDVKGDLLYHYGNYFIEKGYALRTLNLKKPLKSDRYNPFEYVRNEQDIIKLITNLQASVRKPDAMSGDPFWDDGARLYLQSLFMYEFLEAKEQGRKGTMNNILKLVNAESKVIDPDDGTTELSFLMEVLATKKGSHYPPVRDYRKLKEGASETVRSILLIINAMLSLCETSEVKRIFEADDMNIRELGVGVDGNPKHPVILFLVLPDNDTSYNFLISMFYTQMFDILMDVADEEVRGPLPIEVEVWMDEFYAGAKPNNPDALLGVVRSRNITMIPILQSISQIKTLFKDSKWETIMDNVATVVYLGSGPAATGTHETISKILGNTTIDSRNEGLSMGKNGNMSNNYQRMTRELMKPDEVKRIPREDCIVFLESRDPIYDQKAIPFDTEIFKYANSLPKYIHPIETIWNEKELLYGTIKEREQVQFLSEEDVAFYREAAKNDERIHIFDVDEESMLYLNWSTPQKSTADIEQLFAAATPKSIVNIEPPEDVTKDLSGSVIECLERYHALLSDKVKEVIISSLETGLPEERIKNFFFLSDEETETLYRAYRLLKVI